MSTLQQVAFTKDLPEDTSVHCDDALWQVPAFDSIRRPGESSLFTSSRHRYNSMTRWVVVVYLVTTLLQFDVQVSSRCLPRHDIVTIRWPGDVVVYLIMTSLPSMSLSLRQSTTPRNDPFILCVAWKIFSWRDAYPCSCRPGFVVVVFCI